MASSSSSAPSSQSPKKYDVFISFRGEDTRFNFTSHLHEALSRSQIDTYIDYRLEKGDEVWPSLEKAIEDSTLFLVIFSEDYASSTWCLKELAKILECSKNQVVMPVFYRVDPSHVRKQSGRYQKAFEEHESKRNINNQQLQKWREALNHAANLSGWHCSFNRDEAELIKEIVNHVLQKLDSIYQSEDDLKGLIGIQKKMADVESLLDKDPNNDGCQFIGIWGMGGLGKTTLARALFKKLHFTYEGFCFLDKVREESKRDGIYALRRKLILNLLGEKESHTGMLDAINRYTMSRLGRKKVFIVLDDVDDLEQIENLVGRHEFGRGSKILITTRDRQVLAGIEGAQTYRLDCLNSYEAFDLFSINAFSNDCTDKKIKKLAKKVIQYGDGHPLALKVLGSLLNGKNQEAWESQLDKLQKFPCPKINHILKSSFELLDKEERNIFLHIACFFDYYDVECVKKMLNAYGYSTAIGLERLEEKALLDVQEGRIGMHHLIKEMGKEIVRDESLEGVPKKCSILWIFKNNSEILKKNMGSGSIEGMILNLSEVEEMSVTIEAVCSMPKLKFLRLYGNFNGQFRGKLKFPSRMKFLTRNLMLLDWVGCPLKTLPTKFKCENLVQINMPNSNLTKLWEGEQDLVNLSTIDLRGSKDLLELPNFSKAVHLVDVILEDCSKLQNVHPSILSLHSLRRLLLRNCEALTSLTSNTHLKSLIKLDLVGCSRLSEFSVTSEKSEFQLMLLGTAINGELCSSSGHLNKVYFLNLDGCEGVTSLHQLFDLHTLRRLDAAHCNKLAPNLHSTFDAMRALQVLRLKDCSELFGLPDNISLLSSLRELDFSGTNIETLPLSIKHLSSLQNIILNGCEWLLSVPELPPSISRLSADNCLSLGTLHSPLKSEDSREEKQYYHLHFSFKNCMKLDGESIKGVESKVLLDLNDRAIYHTATMKYPGTRVAQWFTYRTMQSFVTVDLSSIPQPWDGVFIFCVVISGSSGSMKINAKLSIDGQYACMSESAFWSGPLLSDHVLLWYDAESCGEVQRTIEEKQIEAQSSTYRPLLQIEFITFFWGSVDETRGEIKECGVCPTSAAEYQNYVKQIQLPLLHPRPNSNAVESMLQLQPNSEGIKGDCSCDNTNVKEVVTRKSKDFTLPGPPTLTWKNRTRGLKDIMFL